MLRATKRCLFRYKAELIKPVKSIYIELSILPIGLILEDCPLTLGMEDGRVPDNDVTVSSEADGNHTANHGRLNSESYWKPAINGTGEWLQVCFPQRMLITGIITQGGGVGDNGGWVEYLKLEYRTNDYEENWWIYREYGPDHPTDIVSITHQRSQEQVR